MKRVIQIPELWAKKKVSKNNKQKQKPLQIIDFMETGEQKRRKNTNF